VADPEIELLTLQTKHSFVRLQLTIGSIRGKGWPRPRQAPLSLDNTFTPMISKTLSTLTLFVALGSALLNSAPAPRPLSAALQDLNPTRMLPVDPREGFELRNHATDPSSFRTTWLDANAASPTLRIETTAPAGSPGAVAATWVVPEPIRKGDVGLVRFYARATQARQESGEGAIEFIVALHNPPGDRIVVLNLGIAPEWTLFEIPFSSGYETGPNRSAITLGFGALQQTLEIAGLEFHNFGPRTEASALPSTRFSYEGREPGAAWRKAALARIDEIRTAPLQIRVVDATQRPVAGAEVKARLVRPAFQWGSAVSVEAITADDGNAEIYRQKVRELFDTVTIDNGLKWPRWSSGPEARARALQTVEWIYQNGLRQRGHTLVWPGMKFAPRFVVEMPPPKADLPRLIEEHIRDIVTATKGKIVTWDVLNEPVHERHFFDYMPESTAATWFKLVRELDPSAKLVVNEYAMLNTKGSPKMIADFIAFAERMTALGAPIDKLGVQGHIGRQVRNPVDVLSDLDLLQKSGWPVEITEFDINTPDEALQADYFRDFLIACYSHPVVETFIMWGFWQPRHWRPDAAMYRADWSEKPNGKVWRELVLGEWRTKFDQQTDADGRVGTRGHFGRYEVTITRAGVSTRHEVELTRSQGDFTLQLK
jgi:endo-1,4-beta-xylanase